MKPRQRNFAILGACAAAAAIAFVLYGISVHPVHEGGAPPAILDKLKISAAKPAAPDIAFSDADGKEVKLADFHGRAVLLNLWATWCGPCIIELPELAKLNAALAGHGVAVVAVDMERLDAAKVKDFLALHGADGLPIYIDRHYSAMRGFAANELPLTVLIDATGHEIARAAGGQKWADPAVIAYLKGVSSPTP